MSILNWRKKSQDGQEVTPGGSPIYRYEEPESHGWRPPESYGVYAEEITNHFEQIFPGRKSFVFHEIISDLVHIDVNVLRPDAEHNYQVLYTTGMSDLPMTLPEELSDRADLKYAELFLFLPGDWDLGKTGDLNSDLSPAVYWPIGILKYLARFPHEYHTWLGWGHTIPNGPQYAPLADGTAMSGVVLSHTGGDTGGLNTRTGQRVNFYLVIPAYKEEIEFKLAHGMDALNQRFSQGELPMILDMLRPNLCADFTEVLDGE